MSIYNEASLDSVCGAYAYAMGIEPPKYAAPANPAFVEYIDRVLAGEKVDRMFFYNPDAVAQWVYEKYDKYLAEVKTKTELELPLCSVMPSVTPVCFATLYSGTQPEVHGIRKYEKPVLTVDTLFDALIRAGKKVAVVAQTKCSIAHIFLEREMDYYRYDTNEQINAKASELIMQDTYDVIVCYNGNYDSIMHKFGPESYEALAELRCNARTYGTFDWLIRDCWKHHNTLVGFAMDHGCHEIDDNCGSHGLDMPEDLNIVHRYQIYPAQK